MFFWFFLPEGIKDSNLLVSHLYQLSKLQQWSGAAVSYLRWEFAPFIFEEWGLQCHPHHSTGHNQRTSNLEKGASLQAWYIRTFLSSSQQDSRTKFPHTELEHSDDNRNTRYKFQKVQANSFCLFISRFIQIA